MNCPRALLFAACLLISALGVVAGVTGAEPAAPVKITLHPAAEPTPALKYRLLPGRMEQIPGNAAVHYGKVTAEETRFFGDRQLRENIEAWLEMPLDQLLRDKVHLPSQGGIEFSIRRGAHCKFCDWQLPIGDAPFYGILLPEVQQIRQFGRILGVRARLQMVEGKYDDAVETLQAGYAMARHVANGETLVNGLVGIAICGILNAQVEDFVQQPGAPNLYWALANLPTPLIESRDALDVEAMGVELSFPELRDVRTAQRTPNEWRDLFHRFAVELIKQISHADSPEPPSPEALDALCEQRLAAAKQALIAGGLPASEVDSMSKYQVALLYSLQTYHELFDDAVKYYFLPYPQAKAGIEGVIERAKEEKREILPIADRLFPAITASHNAMVRTDRQIAVLRVLEALRIHAATHEGKLPEGLEELTEVPIPDDPVTGLPFVYLREGEKAILTGPALPRTPLNYEITMEQLPRAD